MRCMLSPSPAALGTGFFWEMIAPYHQRQPEKLACFTEKPDVAPAIVAAYKQIKNSIISALRSMVQVRGTNDKRTSDLDGRLVLLKIYSLSAPLLCEMCRQRAPGFTTEHILRWKEPYAITSIQHLLSPIMILDKLIQY